jgi:hypothetical protein
MSTIGASPHCEHSRRGGHDLRLDAIVRSHEKLLVATTLAVVTVFSLVYARVRPFWMDEYLTYDTAILGSPTAVWKSLNTLPLSVDPPLYHILLQYWLRVVSPSEFAARLPSVFCYTIMCLFLYLFVRKYMDIYAGLIAVVLSLACGAFRFAHEARPYALVLGAVSMILFCWATIIEEQKNRMLVLLALWAGVAIVVGSHWFGCLALVPFILGELVRSRQVRTVDVWIWLALTTGAASIVLYLPLVTAASAYRSLPWKGVSPWDAFETFAFVLEPCLIPLTVLMTVFAVMRFVSDVPYGEQQLGSIPGPVFTCVIGLALISFPALLFAKLITHVFIPRYVLFCAIGLLVLISEGISSMIGTRALWRVVALLTITGCVLLMRIHEARIEVRHANRELSSLADIGVFSQESSIPVVLSDDEGLFLRLEAHAPTSLRRRCIWVTDPSVAGMASENTIYLSIQALRQWTRDPISDLSSFLSSYQRFYLISDPRGWMIQRLIEAHAKISLQGTFADDAVFLISVNR